LAEGHFGRERSTSKEERLLKSGLFQIVAHKRQNQHDEHGRVEEIA